MFLTEHPEYARSNLWNSVPSMGNMRNQAPSAGQLQFYILCTHRPCCGTVASTAHQGADLPADRRNGRRKTGRNRMVQQQSGTTRHFSEHSARRRLSGNDSNDAFSVSPAGTQTENRSPAILRRCGSHACGGKPHVSGIRRCSEHSSGTGT